jgi:hypothetical protein
MNNKNLQVATPDVFDTEYKEVFITKLGYGGLQDKDAWIAGQFGYIWFDNDTKKIFKVYTPTVTNQEGKLFSQASGIIESLAPNKAMGKFIELTPQYFMKNN